MSPHQSRASFAAALQILAAYVVDDLLRLRYANGAPASDARERLVKLRAVARAGKRGAMPAYPAPVDQMLNGGILPERSARLKTLDSDDDVFEMLRLVCREPSQEITVFVSRIDEVVTDLLDKGWDGLNDEERAFVEADLTSFLQRVERLDQLDEYRPSRRENSQRR